MKWLIVGLVLAGLIIGIILAYRPTGPVILLNTSITNYQAYAYEAGGIIHVYYLEGNSVKAFEIINNRIVWINANYPKALGGFGLVNDTLAFITLNMSLFIGNRFVGSNVIAWDYNGTLALVEAPGLNITRTIIIIGGKVLSIPYTVGIRLCRNYTIIQLANYTYITYPGLRHYYYQYMTCNSYYTNGTLYYNGHTYRMPGVFLAYPSGGLIIGLANNGVWVGSRFFRIGTPAWAWAFKIGSRLYIIAITESGRLIVIEA